MAAIRRGSTNALLRLTLLLLATALAAVGWGAAANAEDDAITVNVVFTAQGTPATGLNVTVVGQGASEQATTDAQGHASVEVPAPGAYQFFLDASTVPAGVGVEENPVKRTLSGSLKTQTVRIDLQPGVTTPVAEPTGASATAAPSASAGESAAPSGQPSAATDAEGAVDPSATAAAGDGFWTSLMSKVFTGLTFGLLLALASVGVSLIYGTTGLNNFAHGELVTFGAFVAYVFSAVLGWNGWLSLAMALLLGGAFGFLQDFTIWKPLRRKGLGLMQIMIVSIGLSLALRYVYAFIFGPDRLTLPADNSAFVSFAGVNLRYWDVVGSLIAIVLLLATAWVLLRTRIGKATRAVADNKALAAASGINVDRVIRIVWIGGAALAAVSGVLVAYYQTLRWDTGASILLLIFAAVVLGGLGTAFGALVGSLIIGVFIDVSTMIIPSNMKYVGALLVMIIVLLFRPQGILGKKQRIG